MTSRSYLQERIERIAIYPVQINELNRFVIICVLDTSLNASSRAFIESTVCHHVKIRVLADQSNNFVEMGRRVRVTGFAEDLLSVDNSKIQKTANTLKSRC